MASAENLMRLFETFVLIVVGSIANHEMGKKEFVLFAKHLIHNAPE